MMAAVQEKLTRGDGGGVVDIVKETISEFSEDEAPTMAAAMTYHAVLAIFPFLLLLAGLTSIVDTVFDVPDLTDRIVDKASQAMPEDATSVLENFVNDVVAGQGGAAIGFGLIGALWAASAGVGTAIKAMNRAYNVEEDRGFVMSKVTAVGLTIVFSVLLLTGTTLIALGGTMAGGIGDWLGWSSQVVLLWNLATPLLALLLIAAAVIILYSYAPNTDVSLRWVLPGTALFLVSWIVFSIGFSFYISNFGSYNRVYGSLGAVIILLLWLYWSNMLLLAGAELNAVVARRHDPQYRADPRSRNEPVAA